MYYLVKIDDKIQIIEHDTTDNYDKVYDLLKRCGVDLHGQFGRLDYAQQWADKYNDQVTEVK